MPISEQSEENKMNRCPGRPRVGRFSVLPRAHAICPMPKAAISSVLPVASSSCSQAVDGQIRRRITIAVVSEFSGKAFDGLVPSAAAEIQRACPDCGVTFVSGFLKQYHQGGLRPSRLLNYCVVYARILHCLLRRHPQVFLVDTTPPLTQWWTALLGFLFRARVYIWLMDYHPEIEARYFDQVRGLGWLARFLRRLDRTLLPLSSGIITLDEAMADVLRSRCATEVKLHPPWSTQGIGSYEPIQLNGDARELRLVYVGNLGAAHPLQDLELILGRAAALRKVRLLYVGENPSGLERFSQMAQRLGAALQCEKRLEWKQLLNRLNAFRPNYGLVTLDPTKRGLVSPCKYATYLVLGLPILYLGPPGTNADTVCRRLGAGLALTHEEILTDDGTLLQSLLDPSALELRQLATKGAHSWQSQFNEVSFVEMIRPWLAVAARPSV